MLKRTVPVVALTLLLMGMLTLAFSAQRAESAEPPAMESNETYGGSSDDFARSVVETSDGGYALAGSTYCDDPFQRDSWLVKADSDGNMQWNRTYGGRQCEFGGCVVQRDDGGYAIAGSTESFGAGEHDFWLVETNSIGNMQWSKTYGGTDSDGASYMVETSDGGYAMAGHTRSFGAGDYDMWLVKTDSDGNMQWNQTYGGASRDIARSLVQTDDGGYAIAGETDSFGAGDYDMWLVKTDSDGEMQWNKTYPPNIHDVTVLDVTPSKTIVGTGFNMSIKVTVENQGDYIETLSVTAYANTTIIDTPQNITLPGFTQQQLTFTWNTTGFAIGNYTISAHVATVAEETETDDNTYVDGVVTVRLPIHDVAVVDVTPSKTSVGQGYLVSINVIVENQGDYFETFNVTAYYNETAITLPNGKNYTTIALTSGNSTTLTFSWNTTGVAKGNYIIRAYAWPVLDEIDTGDNAYTDGTVLVTIPGDVNGDRKVDGKDIAVMSKYFGCLKEQSCYVPNADINCDGKIDGKDIAIASKNFGERDP